MIWLLTVIAIVTGITAYMLLAPFYLEVDTDLTLCRVRFPKLMSVSIGWKQDKPVTILKVLWWQRELTGTGKPAPSSTKPAPKTAKKRRRPMPRWMNAGLAVDIVRSFRIEQLYIRLDTGDVVLNARLYPWMYLLERLSGGDMRVNFLNENTLKMRISNTAARICRIIIYHLIKSKT